MTARARCIACDTERTIKARGLCWSCYRRRDQIAMPETRTEYVLSEWDWLRRYGVSIDDAAPRLGIKPASLDRALHRALAKGDQRGRHETCPAEKYRTASEAMAS